MNCSAARQAIEQLPEQGQPQGELAAHLNRCELCRHYLGDRLLERELAQLQVPEPSEAFLQQAFSHAVAAGSADQAGEARQTGWLHRPWLSAVAASVLVATIGLFALFDSSSPDINGQVAEAPAAQAQEEYRREEVRIVIYSAADHDDAEFSIELAENLELEGHAGSRQVNWTARLSEGNNMMTLPVLIRNEGGQVRVTSRFGGNSHEVEVDVSRNGDSA